jgi:hypothetical protein
MREIWRKTQYKYYEVSNFGRVRSKKRKEIYIMNQRVSDNGYKQVWISDSGKSYNRTVHRLVAKAFIPNTFNKPEVNHIDGDKTNNHISNLEWATRKENENHARRWLGKNDALPRGEEHWNSVLNWEMVRDIRAMYNSGKRISEIAGITGIHRRTISDVVNFETWAKDENIL